jgi:cell division protein FtsI (penicillin-binding protein 3)
MTERGQSVRLWAVGAAVALVFAGLAARLATLHLGPNERLRERVTRTRRVEQPILVGRGRVLDREGNILAMDLAVNDVCADPARLVESGHAVFAGRHLARLLELEPAMVLARLNRPDRRFAYIKRQVPDDDAARVRALKLQHVWFEPVSGRHYPHANLMAHVLGFSNAEGIGSAGIEQQMHHLLKGRPGVRVSEQDGRGEEMLDRRSLEIAPQAGADVDLTLDLHLQQIVEAALDDAVAEHQARGAWAIVQRVSTGEILAMAARPDYDLNRYNRSAAEDRLNRAIGYVYEPGSTFKMAVIAAALRERVVAPGDVFDCENGCWYFRGRPLHDFHPYGRLTVADVVKKSSNIGAAKIALALGDERLDRYLRAFGIGSRTGVELPGEEGGILHPRAAWTGLSATRIAMGHEVGVTSLQMLNVLCAIANRGFLMRPAVVRRVVDAHGRTIRSFEPAVLSRPLDEETARLMLRLLTRVTEEGGTGTKAAFEGYTVAGKTGTAQKPEPGGYSDERNIASFVGVVPAEDPQIGIVVVVDEPQPLHTGGQVSAPVFREIARQAVRYLDIAPANRRELIDPESETSPGTAAREVPLDPPGTV